MMNDGNLELDHDRKKRIIQDYLQKLMQTDPNLYYSPTADVAREVHLMIKEHINRMNIEDRSLFKNLTVRDVEVFLAFR